MRVSSTSGAAGRLLAVLGLLATGAAGLRAQEAPIVLPGDRVRVQLGPVAADAGRRLIGTIERVGRDTIWFVPEPQDSAMAITWNLARRIERSTAHLGRREAVGRGAAIGAGVGLVVAAIDFAASGGSCSDMRNPSCFLRARGLAEVMGGAALGALVGLPFAGEQWKQVYPMLVPAGVSRTGSTAAAIACSIRVR